MFRILVVDDEPLIRNSISALIGDMKDTMCVVGTASNGEDALRILSNTTVDFVLTDIRMPVMDGIELIRHCNGDTNGALCLVLTAYDEFELVRDAYAAGARDYILKTEICAERVRELAMRHRREVYDRRYQRTNTIEIQNLLRLRLSGTDGGSNDETRAAECGSLSWAIVILKLQWPIGAPRQPLGEGWARRVFLVASVELDGDEDRVGVIPNLDGTTIVVFELSSLRFDSPQKADSIVRDFIEEVATMAKTEYGATLAGSYCPSGYGSLCKTYRHAQYARDDGFVHGDTGIVRYRGPERADELLPEGPGGSRLAARLAEYLDSVRAGGEPPRVNDLLELSGGISANRAASLRAAHRLFLQHFVAYAGVRNDSLPLKRDLAEYQTSVANDVGLPALNACLTRCLQADYGDNPVHSRLVQRTIRYITDRIDTHITLDETAEYLTVSPAHLTRAFSRELGCGFAHYVAKIKIDEAKKLIRHSDLRLYEIAYRLGYKNPETFSRTFKRICGVSPGRYT